MSWRARAFLGWLFFVTLAPALLQLLPVQHPLLPVLPWLGLVLALVSLLIVVRPHRVSPLAWLGDVASAAARVLPTHSPAQPSKEKLP